MLEFNYFIIKHVKLHLGCGKRYIEGWTHVDAIQYDHIDFVAPIDNLHFISSNSVELIYASHVLEHFHRPAVQNVLMEWYRTLKPNGCLRLAVPDFRALAMLYNHHQDIEIVKGPICGRQDHKYNFHYNIFDQESLTYLLENIGFVNCRLWDWKDTEHSRIDDFSQAYYPHMDKENGLLVSLNIEAFKR